MHLVVLDAQPCWLTTCCRLRNGNIAICLDAARGVGGYQNGSVGARDRGGDGCKGTWKAFGVKGIDFGTSVDVPKK